MAPHTPPSQPPISLTQLADALHFYSWELADLSYDLDRDSATGDQSLEAARHASGLAEGLRLCAGLPPNYVGGKSLQRAVPVPADDATLAAWVRDWRWRIFDVTYHINSRHRLGSDRLISVAQKLDVIAEVLNTRATRVAGSVDPSVSHATDTGTAATSDASRSPADADDPLVGLPRGSATT